MQYFLAPNLYRTMKQAWAAARVNTCRVKQQGKAGEAVRRAGMSRKEDIDGEREATLRRNSGIAWVRPLVVFRASSWTVTMSLVLKFLKGLQDFQMVAHTGLKIQIPSDRS